MSGPTGTEAPGTPGSVRPAVPSDAPRLARVQVDTWRLAYGGLLPADALASLDAEAGAQAWAAAISVPPGPGHHVLVAVDGPTGDAVGFAALAPATDEDAAPARDGELAVLVVDPAHAGRGHGSRLLAAAADVWRAEGVVRATAWVLDGDEALGGLLLAAGWGPDGSRRTLTAGGEYAAAVEQVRLHTDLTPADGSPAGEPS